VTGKHLYIPIYVFLILLLALSSLSGSIFNSSVWDGAKETFNELRGGGAQLAGGVPITGQIAFPGAEGFGALARGGRGGEVLFVTNLNDSGPGSLRAALEASGPRTVVFRVGGTIVLERNIRITNPYVTIAGQTAPGGGITLRYDSGGELGLLDILTHDVIVRYIRIRPGPNTETPVGVGTCCLDALNIREGAHDVIIDHVSVSWATDEIFSIGDVNNITIQWSILSEGLFCSTDNFNYMTQPGGYCNGHFVTGGAQLVGNGASSFPNGLNITIHHSLYAHTSQRNPKFDGPGHLDFINNIIYDPGHQIGVAGNNTTVNYIGNLIKAGPVTDDYEDRYLLFETSALAVNSGTSPEIYYTDNIIQTVVPEVLSQRALNNGAVVSSSRFSSPWVTEVPASQVQNIVLGDVGANRPQRDSVDSRVVNDVNNRTGFSAGYRLGVNYPSEVGGWPIIVGGTAPTDSDSDGMPDSFESSNGLDPNSASDRNGDLDGDGFTNLEEYLNSLTSNPGDGVGGTVAQGGGGLSGGSSSGSSSNSNTVPEEAGPPPTVNISNLTEGDTVSGLFTIRANAMSSSLVDTVEFQVDGESIRFDNNSPYGGLWETRDYPNGTYTVTVIARDIFNQTDIDTVQVTVNNTQTIAQASPQAEQTNTNQVTQSSSQSQVSSPPPRQTTTRRAVTTFRNTLNAIFPLAQENDDNFSLGAPVPVLPLNVQQKEAGEDAELAGEMFDARVINELKDIKVEERLIQGVESQLATPMIFYILGLLLVVILAINNERKRFLALLLIGLIVFGIVRASIETSSLAFIQFGNPGQLLFLDALLFYFGVFSGIFFSGFVGLLAPRPVGLVISFIVTTGFLTLFVLFGVN